MGTFILIFLSEYLRGFGQFRFIIYGSLIILSVLFIPGGLATAFQHLENRIHKMKMFGRS